jgi:hypothetical protein
MTSGILHFPSQIFEDPNDRKMGRINVRPVADLMNLQN